MKIDGIEKKTCYTAKCSMCGESLNDNGDFEPVYFSYKEVIKLVREYNWKIINFKLICEDCNPKNP